MQSEAYSEEESKNPPTVGVRKRATPRRRCPDEWQPNEYAIEAMWAECPDVDIAAATRKFRDHEFARGRTDWLATWRNWIREEQARAVKSGKTRPTRYDELMRQGSTPASQPSEAALFLAGKQ